MVRDDIIEYSLNSHHSEEEGKKIRKNILLVTLLLTAITVVEVIMGMVWGKSVIDPASMHWSIVKLSFIVLTLVKAGYIVMVFMHLGDERKNLKWTILAPYAMFILYLIFICLMEASAVSYIKDALGWV